MVDGLYSPSNSGQVRQAIVSASSLGENGIVAAVPGKRIRVIHYLIVADGAVDVKFTSDDGSSPLDLTGAMPLAANSALSPCEVQSGYFQTREGDALSLNLSGAVAVGGHLSYLEY